MIYLKQSIDVLRLTLGVGYNMLLLEHCHISS